MDQPRFRTGMMMLLAALSIIPMRVSYLGPSPVLTVIQDFSSGVEVCEPPVEPVVLIDPIAITDCTPQGIQQALNAGGHIEFDCGSDPISIAIDSQLELSVTTDTVLDGGGLVTLDGQGLTRILHKGWHNPDTVGTVAVTIQNLRFVNGKAPSGGDTGAHSGGAISSGHPGTRLHIINSKFQYNRTTDTTTADNQGGAIFSSNSYETIIVGSVFEDNAAGNGGAFGGIATGLFVFNSRFTGNSALDSTSGGIVRGYGGAIHLDGVTNNYNPNSNKRVHICGSVFEHNTGVRGGGATSVVVSDKKGIMATYEKSTFADNRIVGQDGGEGKGGAIYHIEDDHAGGRDETNLEISESTFNNNRTLHQGGAVWLYILGKGSIVNSTLEGNRTTAPLNQVGQGGAMVIALGRIDIINVTFANNHAAFQAGALHGGGDGDPDRVITLANTIFANNTLNEQELPYPTRWQGYHTNRPMEDGGQNIQWPRFKPTYENDVNNNITANPIYTDPLLLPIGDNGGPNHTMALDAVSPGIDAGADVCPSTDQRGFSRNGQCDIGAYEFLPNAVNVLPNAQAIKPGARASYCVTIYVQLGSTQSFALTASSPSPDLVVSVLPQSITPDQTATVIITDTHSGTLFPGLWHTVAVTATAGELTLHATANLLVGGVEMYLPAVTKCAD